MSEPERPANNLAGTVLEGAYRLVRLMGVGGMGAVYEATQLRLNKRVAIKLMARELSSNQEALARFHREAEITSQLGHPHLVNVVDFGTSESGEPYLVMEYLEGEDLEHRLAIEKRLSVEVVVNIIKQAASALGAAHAKEVVHRDLKPANIFLMSVPGEPDFVKVLDFGISKVKAARAKLTRATAVVGTPAYMSPEQAAGRVEETDHRADQWALACIAWEMIAGRTPFVGDDVMPLFYQITNLQPPALVTYVTDLPAEVEPVLLRALAKRPDDRFPTIRAFSRAFEEAALGRPADVTPTPIGEWSIRTSAVRSGLSGVSQPQSPDVPALRSSVERGVSKHATTFSHTTGEVTYHGRRRWFRPVHAVIAAAALLLVAGVVFLRTSAPVARTVPVSPAPPVPPVAVAPAPVAPPAPAIVLPLPPEPPPSHLLRNKLPTDERKTARVAEPTAKRKIPKAHPTRRIFQEL